MSPRANYRSYWRGQRGTPPTLFDCLPEEMAELVDKVKCPASFDDQKTAVLDAISAAAKQGIDSKVKPKVSESQRYEWTDRFAARLRPVMAACTAAYALIIAQSPAKRRAAAKKYLAAWQRERDHSIKANYGSDREVTPLDQYFLNTFIGLFRALGLRDKATLAHFTARLNDCKFKPPYLLIELIGDLALHKKTIPLSIRTLPVSRTE